MGPLYGPLKAYLTKAGTMNLPEFLKVHFCLQLADIPTHRQNCQCNMHKTLLEHLNSLKWMQWMIKYSFKPNLKNILHALGVHRTLYTVQILENLAKKWHIFASFRLTGYHKNGWWVTSHVLMWIIFCIDAHNMFRHHFIFILRLYCNIGDHSRSCTTNYGILANQQSVDVKTV